MGAIDADTIAAVATAAGAGGVAIVRVSGPDALPIVATLTTRPERLCAVATHTVHHHWLRDANQDPLDETLVTVMRSPHTFTGEDVVEIGVHGGGVSARRVLRAVLAAGARLAERGEFTKRAFLNGRMDLCQAEAVVDLIEARTDRGADAALASLAGKLAERTIRVEDLLLDLLARLEVNLDFNEDVSAVGHDVIGETLREATDALVKLQARVPWGRRLRDGAVVALVGKPNAGKSSLFNSLLEDDRAIVSAAPGTTRDYLEAWIEIEGVPVRLLDTAGQRLVAEGGAGDAGRDKRDGAVDGEAVDFAETDGIRRAREWEASADIRVHVVDLSCTSAISDLRAEESSASTGSCIIVGNKADLTDVVAEGCDVVVSALTGEGVEELRSRLGQELVVGMSPADTEPLPGERHEDAIRRAVQSLKLATESWRAGATEELMAGDVRDAATFLGEITGKTVGPEVLDRIFSRFCIGK